MPPDAQSIALSVVRNISVSAEHLMITAFARAANF